MSMKKTTPESCGISSRVIEKFIRMLDENGYAMHSVLMARAGKLFYEGYWAPFDREHHHRMNSVSKSFVGIAIGLLIEDGVLTFDMPIASFFPEESDLPEETAHLTVYDLLTMRTPVIPDDGHWVRDRQFDRIHRYFRERTPRPTDTSFLYDSAGSYLLSVIVERATGQTLTEYLQKRLLGRLGFSEKTDCIKTPEGYSWGDSGLLVRPLDLLTFAAFVMNGGIHEGKRLMNEEFLRLATSRISDSNLDGYCAHDTFGYGMQFWKSYEDGFSMNGMGGQFAVCIPKYDFIFVCTADNQGNTASNAVILSTLYHSIVKELSKEPLSPNPAAQSSLDDYTKSLKLVCQEGEKSSPYTHTIEGIKWKLNENPMKIEWLRVRFEGNGGSLDYKNTQGEKTLPFALGKNLFTTFPQDGYPNMQIGTSTEGYRYPCAVSASWTEERKLAIRVQMIGKHLGGLYITLAFCEDEIGVRMLKNTNCFLNEYQGFARGLRSPLS